MKRIQTQRLFGALALASAAVLAAGCDRADDGRSAGQRLDSAVARADAQAERVAAEARTTGKELSRELGNAAHDAVDKVKDASITSAVNAKLLGDSQLSALQIDVDTVDGHVRLSGNAPDAASKEHAGTLAARTDGVVSVDNQLVIAQKSEGKG